MEKPEDADLSAFSVARALDYLGMYIKDSIYVHWTLTVSSQNLSQAIFLMAGMDLSLRISPEYDQDTWKLTRCSCVKVDGEYITEEVSVENPGA